MNSIEKSKSQTKMDHNMAYDDRNFRSAYYKKVGFRNEEKKSLEILLKDKPLDKTKLKQFCLRFSVPATYRNLVWKLLLGVVPPYPDSHAFVMDQRTQEYKELLRALYTLRVVDTATPKDQIFNAIWLLQSNNLNFETNFQSNTRFMQLVHCFMAFFDDDVDIYWLTKYFYDLVHKYENDYVKLIELVWYLLEKEDLILYKHLQKYKISDGLPLRKWFDYCFAGIFNEAALAKILDKLCAGSDKILVFVTVALVLHQKQELMKCLDLKSALHCLKHISEEAAELIANKSIEIWQQHGSPLTVHDKPPNKQ